MTNYDRRPDEETPLLRAKSTRTPLPGQIILVSLALVAEPLSSAYIFPFINQLIKELDITGGDDRKIGYYAGLIESLFFITQAMTAWQWSRMSDFVGRRPIVLFGLIGLSASNFAFGLSRTMGALIISRCIAGFLNGNVGVMKSIVGDITDPTNMTQAFALLPVIFSTGITIAPLYGGALVKPQERWPGIFRSQFWATFPYFLPSFVSGCFTLFAFLVCAVFLKESLPSKGKAESRPVSQAIQELGGNSPVDDERPIPMTTLLKTYSVMLPILNYGILALAELSFFAILPLFCSSPIEIGGLGLPPSIIGIYLAVFGMVNSVVQAFLSPRIIEWLGRKKALSCSFLSLYPRILTFPAMSAFVMGQGMVGPMVWVLLVIHLICMVIMSMSFSIINVIVTSSSPNKQSLGTTNGLCQSLTSIARAIGPAMGTSLFAVSKEYDILWGNMVYVILAGITTILVFLSQHLPDDE